MSTRTKGIVGLLALATLSVALVITPPEPAGGQAGKAEFKLKLMGIDRTLDPWKLFAEWAQTVEKRTSGRVQFELTSLPELSLGGAETIRVLKTGVVDAAEVYGGYVAGELPMVEILELPGISAPTRRPRRRPCSRGSRTRRRSSTRRPTRSCSRWRSTRTRRSSAGSR